MAKRLQAMRVKGYENGFKLTTLPERLEQPLKRLRPTTYFVNSMSDIFHEAIDESFIELVFQTIQKARWHRFQILTKRIDRMASFFLNREVPPNAWLGVTVEDRESIYRIEALRNIKAFVRFISIEPLLEDLGPVDLENIHWVIVGGESGPCARRMRKEWAENILQQCKANNVAFFFKQWGTWSADGKRGSKERNGRLLAGQCWDEMP
jgi:protein gp37